MQGASHTPGFFQTTPEPTAGHPDTHTGVPKILLRPHQELALSSLPSPK